ncbi:Hypothetical predicted protein, partial [Marmota monax]
APACLLQCRERCQLLVLNPFHSLLWLVPESTPHRTVSGASAGAMPCPSRSDALVFFVNGRK